MNRLLLCLALVCMPCSLFAQQEETGDKLVAVRVAILESNGDLQLKDGANLSAAGLGELVSKLREQKALERYQFFNLASLETQPASIQIGREEPVIAGRNFGSTRGRVPGRVSNVYQQKNTGSMINVVSRVRDDGQIIVELSVSSSRLKKPEQSDDANAVSADLLAPATETLTCQTTALLTPGVSTIIEAGGEDADGKSSRAYIIVSATVN